MSSNRSNERLCTPSVDIVGISSTTQEIAQAAKLAAESDDPSLPKAGENPLDQCRKEIAYYMQCCDRELKKKKNWILTEPYRVQEEYRYGNTGGKEADEGVPKRPKW